MVLLQELSRLRGSFLKLDESQSIMREEMMRVFTDVDSLKKQQQEMEVEQLKIHRSLQKLESHELADISNRKEGRRARWVFVDCEVSAFERQREQQRGRGWKVFVDGDRDAEA